MLACRLTFVVLILATVHGSQVGKIDNSTADCGEGITCFPCYQGPQQQALLSAAPIDCSAPTTSGCTHNARNKIGKDRAVADAGKCCSACANESKCVMWTFFGGGRCNLFSTRTTVAPGSGACVTGGAMPAPAPAPPVPAPGPACKDCPNILLMFTDDQDQILGGWDPEGKLHGTRVMEKTQRLIADKGAFATNWMIHTPICAPSRAELLSGRYLHNIKNAGKTPNSKLCGSGAVGQIALGEKVYPYTWVEMLRVQKGYVTGQFGKLENSDNEGLESDMRAFDRYFTGTFYQGGTYADSESPDLKFDATDYHSGYGTSVIGNKTIEWLRKVADQGRPWVVYFAPHAPHSPATPPSWYKDACPNVTSPRTPNFDWIGSKPNEFHNLIARQPPFDDEDRAKIDALARKRCQCLLAVDDSYAEIIATVEELGQLDNTYVFITSDHGYNLGQHRIPSNKFLLYDHSLKIPMAFSGPGIAPGTILDFLGTQVDLAPTILGLAGLPPASTFDGKSVVPLLIDNKTVDFGSGVSLVTGAPVPAPVLRHLAETAAPHRRASFHEYYNQGPWEVGTKHALDDWSNTYIGLHIMPTTTIPGSGSTEDGSRSSSRSISMGHLKYGEYDPYGKQSNFTSVYFYELFDLDKDPYELHNIYNESSSELKAQLHTMVREFYECRGAACP